MKIKEKSNYYATEQLLKFYAQNVVKRMKNLLFATMKNQKKNLQKICKINIYFIIIQIFNFKYLLKTL